MANGECDKFTWIIGNVTNLHHAAAMFNRMQGLEGKYAQHYVNRDVT